MNGIEQCDRILCLIGLQWSDEVQFEIGEFRSQCRPFALRFLHPVFAKDALPGGDHGANGRRLESL